MARGTPFWLALALGATIIGFGAAGIARSLDGPELSSYLRWWVGGLLAHDAILLPAAVLFGVGVARLAPPRARAPLQATAYVSAVVVFATMPQLIGEGRRADTPSLQPNDYTANVLLVVALVWAVGAALAVHRMRSSR